MFRSLALYTVLGARRRPQPLGPIKTDQPSMLAIQNTPHAPCWPEICSTHSVESSRHQAAITHSLTGLIGALVGFQIKCIGTVSSISASTSSSDSHGGWDSINQRSGCSSSSSSSSNQVSASSAGSALVGAVSSDSVWAAAHPEALHSSVAPANVQAAKQVLQRMEGASRRKDHASVKQLFDAYLAQQVRHLVALHWDLGQKEHEKTTPSGINLMRSLVIYRTARHQGFANGFAMRLGYLLVYMGDCACLVLSDCVQWSCFTSMSCDWLFQEVGGIWHITYSPTVIVKSGCSQCNPWAWSDPTKAQFAP